MDQQRPIGGDGFDQPLGRRGFEKSGKGVDASVDDRLYLVAKLDEDGRISEREDPGSRSHHPYSTE